MNSCLEKASPKIYQWKFHFPLKAISFQSDKIGRTRSGIIVKYKTEYQKSFIKQVNANLMDFEVKQKLRQPEAIFDSRKHVFVGHWIFLYDNFFTKDGKNINSLNPDLENSKKLIQDILFKHMNLNDRDICLSEDMKWLGDNQIIFVLKLLEKNDFQEILKEKITHLLH